MLPVLRKLAPSLHWFDGRPGPPSTGRGQLAALVVAPQIVHGQRLGPTTRRAGRGAAAPGAAA
jgi:hypothetical protein